MTSRKKVPTQINQIVSIVNEQPGISFRDLTLAIERKSRDTQGVRVSIGLACKRLLIARVRDDEVRSRLYPFGKTPLRSVPYPPTKIER